MTEQAGAGWYDDPEQSGSLRYWDGVSWTEHRSPKVTSPSAGESVADTPIAAARKPMWRRTPVLLAAAFLIGMFMGVGIGAADDGAAAASAATISALEAQVDELTDEVSALTAEASELQSSLDTYKAAEQEAAQKVAEEEAAEKAAEEEAAKKVAEEEAAKAAEVAAAKVAAEEAAAQKAEAAAAAVVAPKSSTGGGTVYVTKTGEKYHASGCSYLSQSKIPMSLSEAKADGYTPCSRCY